MRSAGPVRAPLGRRSRGGPDSRRDSSRPPRNYDDTQARRAPAGPGARRRPTTGPPTTARIFATTFYPDDAAFDALVKTIRATCRTIELFEIARTILAKLERFTVYIARRAPEVAGPGCDEGAGPAAAHRRSPPLYLSVPDGTPSRPRRPPSPTCWTSTSGFSSTRCEAEVDPPKGNFQVINRCGVTGELLAPPNHHRYSQIMQQHHAAKLARMPFEAYRSRIETVREPEVIQQWLEKMKKVSRYVWKLTPARPAGRGQPGRVRRSLKLRRIRGIRRSRPGRRPALIAPTRRKALRPPPADPSVAPPAAVPAAAALSFDSLEEARAHLLSHERDKVVRAAPMRGFPAADAELLPPGKSGAPPRARSSASAGFRSIRPTPCAAASAASTSRSSRRAPRASPMFAR